MSQPINTFCIIGAGTMGSGIAQVAAQSGFNTILFDISSEVLGKARISIQKSLGSLVEKQKLTAAAREAILNRIQLTTNIDDCRADIFIEAIIEKIEAKVDVFKILAANNPPTTIFASNTSSLSISAIQKELPVPGQIAGMHFFNPAPAMKLVEVVKGEQTSDTTAQTLFDLCKQLNKIPVLCNDAPGFIVNRIARHYYLEAMQLVEQGIASIEDIDTLMESAGFKMGPFKLMDLIGMDVNLAVSQSIYDAFRHEERFKPSEIQIEKVKKGDLGRKTGKGFYDYS